MIGIRGAAIAMAVMALFTPLAGAQTLSSYQSFQLGESVASIAKQAGKKPSDARIVHQRPALIQELQWRPGFGFSGSSSTSASDLLFDFYDDELFQILVTYDRYKTEGLTDEDMVDAISLKYGAAMRPAGKMVTFPSMQILSDSATVIASWEDEQYSVNLCRFSYAPAFGLVLFSKRLKTLAGDAIIEAILLDKQEAPQRELELQLKRTQQSIAAKEKARETNKPAFRP